jgi:REP element-mobilizing transposase RayT
VKSPATNTPDHFPHARIDAFVVMPDHLHGILVLRDYASRIPAVGRIRPGSLGTIVRSFKSVVASRINLLREVRFEGIWQRNYFDEIITTEADLDRARQYIRDNPARWDRRRT